MHRPKPSDEPLHDALYQCIFKFSIAKVRKQFTKNWKQLVTFKEGYELWCKGQKADFVDETQDNLATFRDM
jgi:hypothetical protein